MKMAAAAGNGDEQDRSEGSTAHDPADGNDSFSCESLILFPFQSSAHAVGYRTSKLRLWTAPRLTVMTKPQGLTMGATVIRTSGSEGDIVEVRACANGFFFAGVLSTWRTTSAAARVVFPRQALRAPKGEWWFPTGRAVCAEGGVAVHRGDAKWSCPD